MTIGAAERGRARTTALACSSAIRRPARLPGLHDPAPGRPARRCRELAPFPLAVEDAYRDLLFHGPLFQGIVAIDGHGRAAARARGCARRSRRSACTGAGDGALAARSGAARQRAADAGAVGAPAVGRDAAARRDRRLRALATLERRRAGAPRAADPAAEQRRRCATPTTGSSDPTGARWRCCRTSSGSARRRSTGSRERRRDGSVRASTPRGASRSSGWRACSRARATSTPTGGTSSARSTPPPTRRREAWDPDVYYDPDFDDEDRTYCKRGGYLGELAEFDPLAHGIPPVAVGGEPDQWLALHIARDALRGRRRRRAARRGREPARR